MGDCCGKKEEEKKFEGKAKVTLAINNIHCGDCALNIEKSVEHLPGVLSAEVNYVLSTATVYFDPHRVQEDWIKRAITKPGYSIRETLSEKTRTFWKEKRAFVFMAAAGATLGFSWALEWLKWGPPALENQWKSMNLEGSARLLRYTDGERAGILINFSH